MENHTVAIDDESLSNMLLLRPPPPSQQPAPPPPPPNATTTTTTTARPPPKAMACVDMVELVEDGLLDEARVIAAVRHPSAGAVSVFMGTTRDHDHSRHGVPVIRLEYEAYQPMALKEMRKICAEIRQRWKVVGIALVHRLGVVPVGECSVAIAVSSEHRSEAIEACAFAIDRVKQTVPIWKKEIYGDDGSSSSGSSSSSSPFAARWKANEEAFQGLNFAATLEPQQQQQQSAITRSGDCDSAAVGRGECGSGVGFPPLPPRPLFPFHPPPPAAALYWPPPPHHHHHHHPPYGVYYWGPSWSLPPPPPFVDDFEEVETIDGHGHPHERTDGGPQTLGEAVGWSSLEQRYPYLFQQRTRGLCHACNHHENQQQQEQQQQEQQQQDQEEVNEEEYAYSTQQPSPPPLLPPSQAHGYSYYDNNNNNNNTYPSSYYDERQQNE